MVYRVIGLMSGSSLDGLDIVFAEITESGGKWSYDIIAAECYPYEAEWRKELAEATILSALDYQLLHVRYGHYLGEQVNSFIDKYELAYKVGLIVSHGHTSFHLPEKQMTAQLGDGAAIAAITKLPVVADLRAIDVALGGQGAPIVPIGERLFWSEYPLFLNLGGIANISYQQNDHRIAFDICPANRILDMLAQQDGRKFDENGTMAAYGAVNESLLSLLNRQDYYQQSYPKSLANAFGTDVLFPLILANETDTADALRTYTQHIAVQVRDAVAELVGIYEHTVPLKMLVTGGGAHNAFLIECISRELQALSVEVVVPDTVLTDFKEALVMGLIGVLRWREEVNVYNSVTGAIRNSIAGAMWVKQEEDL